MKAMGSAEQTLTADAARLSAAALAPADMIAGDACMASAPSNRPSPLVSLQN